MATQVTLNSGSVDSAGSLLLRTNGTTTAVTVDTSQNVGVGVTPVGLDSRFKNVEVGPTASLSSILVSSTSLLTYLQHNSYVDSSGATKFKYTGGSNYASQYNQNNGSHLWQTSTAAGTGGNACTFTTNMTLDASGNLGVGTTSPSYKITVKGGNANNLLVDNDGSQYTQLLMQRNSTANTGGDLLVDGTNGLMSLRMLAVGSLRFCTSASAGDGTERARIDSSGSLLVGTTGLPINNGKMAVSGISRFYQSSGDSSVSISVDKSSTTTTTSQVFVAFTINNQNTGSGQINANGASQAAFGSFSDARLKENIVDLPPQLDNIMALRPVEFDYIESEGGGHQINFIAQEFEQVYPDAIGERADGMKTLTGWGKTEARLVKAIQEQQALINQLTARITALESA